MQQIDESYIISQKNTPNVRTLVFFDIPNIKKCQDTKKFGEMIESQYPNINFVYISIRSETELTPSVWDIEGDMPSIYIEIQGERFSAPVLMYFKGGAKIKDFFGDFYGPEALAGMIESWIPKQYH